MKNYKTQQLKKIIALKEDAMLAQIKETDTLRRDNTRLRLSLEQQYNIGYNQAIEFAKWVEQYCFYQMDKGYWMCTIKLQDVTEYTIEQLFEKFKSTL
jgi:hypothetical protein